MFVIVRNRTKRRLTIGCRILVALFIVSLIVSHIYNMYSGTNVIREGWLREDSPSGHPLRVENIKESAHKDNPGLLDQFVIKLRDFYQKDQ